MPTKRRSPVKLPAKPKRPARKPQARGDATRERLLEVARDEFVRRGFHGTSMRQIASAAGLAVGGIYNHFGSKEEVFAAVLEANHPYRVVIAALQDVKADSLEDFVHETATGIWAAVQGRQQLLLSLLSTEMVEFQGAHMQAIVEIAFPQTLAVIGRLMESDENRPLPAPVVLRTLVSLLVGNLLIDSIFAHTALGGQLDYDWIEASVDIFLHGVVKNGQ